MEGPADSILPHVNPPAVAHPRRVASAVALVLLLGVPPLPMPAGPISGDEKPAEPGAPSRRSAAAPTARRNLALARRHAGSIKDPHMRVDALCAIAAAQVEAGDTAGAKLTFQEAISLTNLLKPPTDSLRGWALNRIAATQAKAGLLADAETTAAKITDASPKSTTLTQIAAAQAKKGDPVEAKRRIDQAEEAAETVEPDVFKVLSLLEIADTLAKTGDVAGAGRVLDAAKAVVAKRPDRSLADGELCTIAERQVQLGDMAGATATAAIISAGLYKVQALCAIVAARARAGERATAKTLIEQAEAAAAGITDASFKALAMGQIALAWATVGDPAKATAIVSTITEPASQAASLVNIAGLAAKAGDLVEAKRLVGEAKAAALVRPGAVNAETLGWIAEAQVWVGDLAGARATASEIPKIPPDPYGYHWIEKLLGLDKLAATQAKAGDLVGAKATVAMIPGDLGGERGARAIGAAQVWAEGITAAERWARRLNKPLEACYARLGIAEAATASAQGKARPKPNAWEDP